MTMTMPAMIARGPEYAWISAPITLALAPSATKTVENPNTNSKAAETVSRLTCGFGSLSAKRSSEVPAR